MIYFLFRFIITILDLFIGVVFKWWSWAEIRNYWLSFFRLYRSVGFILVYLDFIVVWLVLHNFPGVLEWLWSNLYLPEILSLLPTPWGPDRQDELRRQAEFKDNLVKQKAILNGLATQLGGRGLIQWFLRIARMIRAKAPSKSTVKLVKYFSLEIYKLQRDNSLQFVMMYLKGCSVLTQQYVGGMRIPNPRDVGPAISRTRGGLPRIIPAQQRLLIRKGDPEVIRLWLSLFNIYRVLDAKHKLKTDTILHGSGLPIDRGFISLVGEFLGKFFMWLMPYYSLAPSRGYPFTDIAKTVTGLSSLSYMNRRSRNQDPLLRTKAEPFMFSKSSSTLGTINQDGFRWVGSSFFAIKESVRAWRAVLKPHMGIGGFPIFRDKEDVWMSELARGFKNWVPLVAPFIWPLVTIAPASSATSPRPYTSILGYWWSLGKKFFSPKNVTLRRRIRPLRDLGRLAVLLEPAGKTRVIALCDVLTQWSLKPLHDLIFKILAKIPQDGTFDQEAPIHRLRKKLRNRKDKFVASYDLSAATDCLPIQLQKYVLSYMIGVTLSAAWANILVARTYRLGAEKLRYGVGQPMGALSSWASLAITHHFIVQWAAYRANIRGGWFSDYGVLGDDVVIANKAVAEQYLFIMEKIGVKIGLSKSVVSHKGVMEFAKKFYTPYDVLTPIPTRELLVSWTVFPVLMNLAERYRLGLSDLLSLQGYRHRVCGALHCQFSKLPKRARTIVVTYLYTRLPLVEFLTSVSLVKRRQGTLDHSLGLDHLIGSLDKLTEKLLLLVKQGGSSLSYAAGQTSASVTEELSRLMPSPDKHAREWKLRDEDRPFYNLVEKTVLSPLRMDSMVAAGELLERVEQLRALVLRRYFFIDLEEFLDLWAKVDALESECHNRGPGTVTFVSEKPVRIDSQRVVRLYRRLSKFIKY